MNDHFLTILNSKWTKITIKNSKFLSRAYNVVKREDVSTLQKNIIKEHTNANHVVYAYRLFDNTKLFEHYTDAGEPAKSSGPPILKVIAGEDLLNTAIYVVRYFGGTKLGIGGLVKAYTKSAQLALENAKIIKQINYQTIKLKTDYDNLGTILGKIEKYEGKIVDVNYGQKIIIKFKITPKNKQILKKDKELNIDI